MCTWFVYKGKRTRTEHREHVHMVRERLVEMALEMQHHGYPNPVVAIHIQPFLSLSRKARKKKKKRGKETSRPAAANIMHTLPTQYMVRNPQYYIQTKQTVTPVRPFPGYHDGRRLIRSQM